MESVEVISLNVVKFLSEVKKHECLWNSTSNCASTKMQRDYALITIASKLSPGISKFSDAKKEIIVDDLKRKWKHLRDSFAREERSRRRSSSSSRKPYKYYEIMSFIKTKKATEQSGIQIKEEIEETSSSIEFRECIIDNQSDTISLASNKISNIPTKCSKPTREKQTASTSTETAQSQMSRFMIESTENETLSIPMKSAENQVPSIVNKNNSIPRKQRPSTCEGLHWNKFLIALQKLTEEKTMERPTNQDSNLLLGELEARGMENQEPTTSSSIHSFSFSMEPDEHRIIRASNDSIRTMTEMETAARKDDLDCNRFSPVIQEISVIQTKQENRRKRRKNDQNFQIFTSVNTQNPGFRTDQMSSSSLRLEMNQNMRPISLSSAENQAVNDFRSTANETVRYFPENEQKSKDRKTCREPSSEYRKREVVAHEVFECKKFCRALEKSLIAKSVKKHEDPDELFFRSLMLEFKRIPKEGKAPAKCEMIKMIEEFKIDVGVKSYCR